MDCRTFRELHLGYVDRSLQGSVFGEMEVHRAICASCASHDTVVRRSLLLLRNARDIQPSVDFRARLSAKLAASRLQPVRARFDGPSWKTFAAAVSTVVIAGYLATAALLWLTPRRQLALAPVVASAPDFINVADMETMPIAQPGVAEMWPAVQMVEQAPVHFANADYVVSDWR